MEKKVAKAGTDTPANNDMPSTSPAESNRLDFMLYGDPTLNRIVVMQLSTFSLRQVIPVEGKAVYSADHITDDKAYVMVRGSNYMQVLLRDENGRFNLDMRPAEPPREDGCPVAMIPKTIDLPFYPRTGAKNKTLGVELISGIDKPMFALVDTETDQLLTVGGRDVITKGRINNFDGENATGHARWVSPDQFLLADRENNEISLFRASERNGHWSTAKTASLVLSSSVHTFFGAGSHEPEDHGDEAILLYAATEGGDDNTSVPASVTELIVKGDALSVGRAAEFAGGSHHPAMHPNGTHIYAPAADSKVHVINKDTMCVEQAIPAGIDAGHVVMIADRDLALVVNHNDTFMTAIKLSTHEHLKDFTVVTSDQPEFNQTLQSHTGRVSPDKRYYYNFATDSGTFFKVDLETLTRVDELYVGGTPKQAAQPGELF